MCRLFVIRADRPVSVHPALVSAPHSLMRQSGCDLRGECHESGWGIGYFEKGLPLLVRSTGPASTDPLYARQAQDTRSPVILAHIRQASVGGVSLKNTHPFVRGQWLFAHNGTVEGFAENPGPLLQLIPEHLGGEIEGETDSEHLFYALLGRLEGIGQPTEDELTSALTDLILEVVRRYPGSSQEPTRLNVVLTNGEVLLASRWGHSLYSSRVGGTGGDRFIDVADGSGTVNGFAISSEPVTPDGWEEVPDRTLIVGRQDGTSSFKPIRQTPPNG